MNFDIDPRHIETLKSQTLSVAGLEQITPTDCRELSFQIMAKTELNISETTIRRIFGFLLAYFGPSTYTLNALAIYCGYKSWEAFRAVQPKSSHTESTFPIEIVNNPLVSILLESTIPTAVLEADAPNFTVITYNRAYEDATSIKERDIKGQTLWDAFDLEKGGVSGPTLLLNAIYKAVQTKQTVQMPPTHYNLPTGVLNKTQLYWWSVKIVPVIFDGLVRYLILNTHDITDKILHQDAIEEAIMKELTLAENLAITNVKLNLTIKELEETNRELTETKKELEELNTGLEERVFERTKSLAESEASQRDLIYSAPVGIAMFKGPEHIIDIANKEILGYWARDKSVIGMPLATAIPELEGQPFVEILDRVRDSGNPYINTKAMAVIDHYGVFEKHYYDMIYQPVQHSPGVTDSIFVVAVDITDHVIDREKLKESESILRLAITAANIGIWAFDPRSRELTYNSIFAKILGWESNKPMTSDETLGQVTDKFRQVLREVAERAIKDGSDYDFTYQYTRFSDQQVIWLRAIGKVTVNDLGEHCFSGIIRDITDEIDGTKVPNTFR